MQTWSPGLGKIKTRGSVSVRGAGMDGWRNFSLGGKWYSFPAPRWATKVGDQRTRRSQDQENEEKKEARRQEEEKEYNGNMFRRGTAPSPRSRTGMLVAAEDSEDELNKNFFVRERVEPDPEPTAGKAPTVCSAETAAAAGQGY